MMFKFNNLQLGYIPSFYKEEKKLFSTSASVLVEDGKSSKPIPEENEDIEKLYDKVTNMFTAVESNMADINRTELSKESILEKITSRDMPEVHSDIWERKKATLETMEKIEERWDELDSSDPNYDSKYTKFEASWNLVHRNFVAYAESKVPLNKFSEDELNSYNRLRAESESLYEQRTDLLKTHRLNTTEYEQALSRVNQSSTDDNSTKDLPCNPSKESNSPSYPASNEPTSNPPKDSTAPSNKPSSLLDDYADPSLEQPSYMDPDD